jgi:hypothetical protein
VSNLSNYEISISAKTKLINEVLCVIWQEMVIYIRTCFMAVAILSTLTLERVKESREREREREM